MPKHPPQNLPCKRWWVCRFSRRLLDPEAGSKSFRSDLTTRERTYILLQWRTRQPQEGPRIPCKQKHQELYAWAMPCIHQAHFIGKYPWRAQGISGVDLPCTERNTSPDRLYHGTEPFQICRGSPGRLSRDLVPADEFSPFFRYSCTPSGSCMSLSNDLIPRWRVCILPIVMRLYAINSSIKTRHFLNSLLKDNSCKLITDVCCILYLYKLMKRF